VSFTLRLTEDRLGAGARLTLPPAPRVLYARDGATRIETGLASAATTHELKPGTAWHGVGSVVLIADAPAMVWRFDLTGAAMREADAGNRGESRRLLERPIDLDLAHAWLMRCDRVDFAAGGVALPHGHKGGGIRCLLDGTLEVTVGDRPARLMRPGDAWFESGREPVVAKASSDAATAFVRVSILPGEIRGQSSIVYVDPADAARGRPRQYTVYVDAPISLPENSGD